MYSANSCNRKGQILLLIDRNPVSSSAAKAAIELNGVIIFTKKQSSRDFLATSSALKSNEQEYFAEKNN